MPFSSEAIVLHLRLNLWPWVAGATLQPTELRSQNWWELVICGFKCSRDGWSNGRNDIWNEWYMSLCTTLPPFWFDLAFSIAESFIDYCVRYDLQIKENWKIIFYVCRTEKEEMNPTENKRLLILGSKSYTQPSLKWSRGTWVRFVQSQQPLKFELTNQTWIWRNISARAFIALALCYVIMTQLSQTNHPHVKKIFSRKLLIHVSWEGLFEKSHHVQ